MNIKILDSWLRDYLKTKASAQKIAALMSLSSVSIEHLEPYQKDWIYDIEVTTNRPDLMSVTGLAREASTVLHQAGVKAKFMFPKITLPNEKIAEEPPLIIKNDSSLINRICAVIMEIEVKTPPQTIQKRLETSEIRSLNNIIDVTNYVMRTIGHPTHVFDYDKLKTKTLLIRESRKNEKITTLDQKTHTLNGGDIVAEDGLGNILDLIGIMGLENSVVDSKTKRILFFITNANPHKIRQTSMSQGIRTEAAQLNEKNIDPNTAMTALLEGISLYKEIANGKVLSSIIDIYPNKPSTKTVTVTKNKIDTLLGINFPLSKANTILRDLDFDTKVSDQMISVKIPSYRQNDISIPQDLIEEIARIYGYQNLPNEIPPLSVVEAHPQTSDSFYWERRAKHALKYWGMMEVYTYPMVSEDLYEGPLNDAVKLKNPLGDEFIYMRKTLVPSLLKIVSENKKENSLKLFEIANVYKKQKNQLPLQEQVLAGVIYDNSTSFFHIKGLIEQLGYDFGIKNLKFNLQKGLETDIYLKNTKLGTIQILEKNLIVFEINFSFFILNASLTKVYTPINKFPPVLEDLSFNIKDEITTAEIIDLIKKQSRLIKDVTLLDRYDGSRTFHLIYQDPEKNLTLQETTPIREKIINEMSKKFQAKIK